MKDLIIVILMYLIWNTQIYIEHKILIYLLLLLFITITVLEIILNEK